MATELRPVKLVLVGMMGSGKSTVGHALVEATGWAYVDNDDELEAMIGMTTREYFESEHGPDDLHGLEVRVLAAILKREPPFVAGAAASVVTSMIGRALLKEHAYVVWLRARLDTLVARVGAGAGRPWLHPDPAAALRRLAEGRDELFAEVADLTVDVDDRAPADVAAMILESLE